MTRTDSRRSTGLLLSAAAILSALGVATAASAAPVDPAPAVGRILQENAAGAVRDSYIVVLKTGAPEAARVAVAAGDLTRRYGGSVGRSYTSAVRGFSMRTSAAAARRLAANPAVAYVEQDRIVTLDGTQSNPTWGLDRLDQRNLPLSGSYQSDSAAGVTAYILDTGIRNSHSDFGGRARSGRDFIDNDADASDCQGHGTHVAGTVGGAKYGVAKDVKLVGVRVLDCQGSGSYSQIIAGVDWVTANAVRPAVANMSLGGSASAALDDAVRRSIASGVTYALAAGNDNQDACTQSPARTAAAITVGASDRYDARASFSNYGKCLDIFAPGVNITSASKAGDTSSTTMSGTSMASPHVAGAAALVLGANPQLTAAEVRDALVNAGTAGKVTNPGTGSPNRLLFTGPTAVPAPTTPAPSPTTPAPSPTTPAPSPTTPAPSPTTPVPTTPVPTTPAPTTPAPATCGPFSSSPFAIIGDLATISSPLAVSGCAGTAAKTTSVEVHVWHGHRGSLVVHLIAPNGTAYPLKATPTDDGTDHLDATYVVDASAAGRNGVWKLRVRDAYQGNIGYLKSWTLRL